MIGTIALARRIEAAETRLSLAMAVSSRAVGVDDAFALPLGGGAAVFCGPGSPMTKVIGLGIERPLTEADIDAIERAYAPFGESPGVEMATLADLASVRLLESRGYRILRIELVLGAELHGLMSDPQSDAIEVTRGPESDWARIAVDGFAAAETVEGREAPAESYDKSALERVIAQFAGVKDMLPYVAYIEGVAAGSASARIDTGLFQLCGAATLPAYRRRGIQTALLTARLADARAEGCDLAVVSVEPGSRSQANVQRHGFAPLYSRLVMAKA
jgi:ribosomal protein S18 acetylase RimI-like enzyme